MKHFLLAFLFLAPVFASAELINNKFGLVQYSDDVLSYINDYNSCGLQAAQSAVAEIIDDAQEAGVDYPDIYIESIKEYKSAQQVVTIAEGQSQMTVDITPFEVVANSTKYTVYVACGSQVVGSQEL